MTVPEHRSRLWLAAGSVVAVGALAMGTLQVVGLVAHEEEGRREVVTAPIRRIDVYSDGGGLRLVRSADATTVVEQRLVHGLARARSTVRVVGERLVVETSCRGPFAGRCSVDLVLAVPDGANVEARASGGGIRATDVDGFLRLESSGGGIAISGGRGGLYLDSSGGGIRVQATAATQVSADSSGGGVRLAFSQPPIDVNAESSGGGVNVEVPSDQTAYRVDARSSGGGTRADIRSDPFAERRITVRSSGGGVTVRYPQQQ